MGNKEFFTEMLKQKYEHLMEAKTDIEKKFYLENIISTAQDLLAEYNTESNANWIKPPTTSIYKQ